MNYKNGVDTIFTIYFAVTCIQVDKKKHFNKTTIRERKLAQLSSTTKILISNSTINLTLENFNI